MRLKEVALFLFYRDEDDESPMRFPIFAISCILTLLATFSFGIYNLRRYNLQTAVPGLATAAIAAAAYVAILFVKHRERVFFVGLLFVDTFLIYLVSRGGVDNSLLLWIFVIPIVSFLLVGRKLGTVSTLYSLAGTLVVLIFREKLSLDKAPALETVSIIRITITFVISGLLSLVYETTRERRYREAMERQRKLEDANQQIAKLSITDSLTGVNNRLFFDGNMPREIKKALRYGIPLALVICDIDHFKKVNDTFGHLTGDLVLKQIASLLNTSVRTEVDWVARCGGEEFAIVLPYTNIEGAHILADRIRSSIEAAVVQSDKGSVKVTASFGVSAVSDNLETTEKMYELSDRRLYIAKNNGRNMVVSDATSD